MTWALVKHEGVWRCIRRPHGPDTLSVLALTSGFVPCPISTQGRGKSAN